MESICGALWFVIVLSGLFVPAEANFNPKDDVYFTDSFKSLSSDEGDLGETYKLLGDNELPILLWWYDDTFPHYSPPESHHIQCPEGKCITSIDRSLQHNDSTRGFLFYGTSFMANDLPLPRKAFHHWALFHEESPKNNWIFSHPEGIKVFNLTATFRRESDYPLASHFIVDPNDWRSHKYMKTTQEKNRLQQAEGLAPLVYVQRDCNPPSDRDSYVKELMKYIRIDSYGPCLHNKDLPDELEGFIKLQEEGFYEFLSRYKFHLSLENAICQDYMTEKVFRPLEIGVVPIYRGSPNITDFMPTNKAVILVDDFDSPKALADFLTMLNQEDAKYEEYLRHVTSGITNEFLLNHVEKRSWSIKEEWERINFGHQMYAKWECYVCDKLHQWDRQIKMHLTNTSIPLPEVKRARHDHMGCPEPLALQWSRWQNISGTYWEGYHESIALKSMLDNHENNSSKFESEYLRFRTDKYP